MKEIFECYKVDTNQLQRNDGFWLDEGRLILRSVNIGELVEQRYQSSYVEARFSLSEADTKLMIALLDADDIRLPERLKHLFDGAAVLDRFKRFCDQNQLKYEYQFLTD
jgi:hypothetical protein